MLTGASPASSFAECRIEASDEAQSGHEHDVAIADLLDNALDKKFVLRGRGDDLAHRVDLIYVGLRVWSHRYDGRTNHGTGMTAVESPGGQGG